MQLISTIRANDWWDYKIPTVLAVAYATIYLEQIPASVYAWRLLYLLLILISGAVFVSVLNDFTDVASDLKAGKHNRLSGMNLSKRRWVMAAATLPCLLVSLLLLPDRLSLLLYLCAILSYVVYSAPPLRFKEHRFPGLITDSAGSQAFPALLAISILHYGSSQPVDWLWFTAVALWSFAFGLRGILWHQLSDLVHDRASATRTFAVAASPLLLRSATMIIFITEAVSLLGILLLLCSAVVAIAFAGYALSLGIRAFAFKSAIVIARSPAHNRYQLIFNEFYQLFLPLSVLLAMAIQNPYGWVLFAIHLLLFRRILQTFIRDMYRVAEKLIRKEGYVHQE